MVQGDPGLAVATGRPSDGEVEDHLGWVTQAQLRERRGPLAQLGVLATVQHVASRAGLEVAIVPCQQQHVLATVRHPGQVEEFSGNQRPLLLGLGVRSGNLAVKHKEVGNELDPPLFLGTVDRLAGRLGANTKDSVQEGRVPEDWQDSLLRTQLQHDTLASLELLERRVGWGETRSDLESKFVDRWASF